MSDEPAAMDGPPAGAPDHPDPATSRPAGRPARRHRAARRGVPLLVVAAVVVQLLLGVVWTVLEPPYTGLDEPQHVAGVMQLVYHHTWPDPLDLTVPRGVLTSFSQTLSGQTGPHAMAPAVPRGQRPSLDALGGATPTPSRSYMAQHPPLYYGIVAAVVRVVGVAHASAWDRVVWLMRVISALLLAPLPLLAWAVMRRFTRSRDLQLGAALVPFLLPSLGRIGGSVSNDALLILTLSVVALGVARIVTGDDSRRTAAWTGVAAMLALLTKGTALVAPAWLALAYLWCWRGGRRRFWAPALTAAVPVALGLVWWVRNIVAFGVVQPAGVPQAPGMPGTRSLGYFARYFFSGVSFRFWSALGDPEPPQLDRSLMQVATYVVLGLMLLGLAVARQSPAGRSRRASAASDGLVADSTVETEKPPRFRPAFRRGHRGSAVEVVRVGTAPEQGGRVAALVLFFAPLAILLIVAEGSHTTYETYGRFAGVQGRYLYPTLIPLLVLPLLALGSVLRGRLRPLVPLLVAVFAGLLQVNAARDVFHTIWIPAGGGLHAGFRVLLAWSPWAPRLTEIGFALLALAASAGAVVLLVGVARRLVTGPKHQSA